jgi:uncharacterized protein YeaO (DUF488 family)
MFTIKRIYADASENDGQRVLVDRLWARGISKEKAHLDLWLKDIAPSDELRKWFSHDPKKWTEFEKRYKAELTTKNELIDQLKKLEKQHKQVTLLYGAKDTEHNNAVVLKKLL